MQLSVHLVVPEASEAAAWYAQAFGAQERSRIPLPGGTVMVVEVDFGGAVVHVGSEFPRAGIVSPLTDGGTATVAAAQRRRCRRRLGSAVQAGASVHHELADAFWGERHGQLTDPFGHRWNLAQRIREVPHAELVAAAAQAFGGCSRRDERAEHLGHARLLEAGDEAVGHLLESEALARRR